MTQTVLVTGHAGFIGYHVARALLERGDSVVGIDVVNDYYEVSLKGITLMYFDLESRCLHSGQASLAMTFAADMPEPGAGDNNPAPSGPGVPEPPRMSVEGAYLVRIERNTERE